MHEVSEAFETAWLRLTAFHHQPGVNLQSFLVNVTGGHVFNNFHLRVPSWTQEQLKAKQDTLIDFVIGHLTKPFGNTEINNFL